MKMKRLIKNVRQSLATLVVMAVGTTATAHSQSLIDTRPAKRLLTVGVHVGDGVSTVRQNYATEIGSVASFVLTPGNVFDVGATAVLNVREFFGIGTGFDFTISNYDFNLTMLDVDGSNGTLNTLYSDNRYYSLDIPVYLRFAFNLAEDRVKLTSEVGAYLGLGVGGRTDTSTYRSSTNALGQSQVTHATYHNDYFDDPGGIINRIDKTDFGLHLAAGLVFRRHFALNAVFHVGMRDIARNFGVYNTTLRNMNLIFKAGYLF